MTQVALPEKEGPQPASQGSGGRRRTLVVVLICLGIALAGGAAGGGIVRIVDHAVGNPGTSGSCVATSVASSAVPSVVTLSVQGPSGNGNGSGEVIRAGGYVLTNDHVISAATGAGGGRIDVLFSDGSSKPATVVGRAPAVDLAVVKTATPDDHPVIRVGDSEQLRVGQPVVALGAPLGLSGTVTAGIVSALGRDVTLPGDVAGGTTTLPGAIQTDASINPGNSGGALVDCRSQLVGVNTAISTVPNEAGQGGGGSVGIGFAIPANLATLVADQLISTGRFVPPYIGMTTAPVRATVDGRATDGLFVGAVSGGGPADRAGLRPGDIVTRIDGRAVSGPDSLVLQTLRGRPDADLTLDYVRAGKTATATVTPTVQP